MNHTIDISWFPQSVKDKIAELGVRVERSEIMGPHMTKFYLSNWWVIHYFTEPDTGYPHNHPFSFESEALEGYYKEQSYFIRLPHMLWGTTVNWHQAGETRIVPGNTIHLLTEVSPGGCWTIINPGHPERRAGFFDCENWDLVKFRYHNETEFRVVNWFENVR